MRAVIQRSKQASVTVDGQIVGQIEQGLVVLLGAAKEDQEKDLEYILEKTVHLRIFPDDEGKMNHSLVDMGGQMLVISQFTLLADTKKGRRPSFVGALEPASAEKLYETFVKRVRALGIEVATGKFGAMMEVDLINHGPVTIILDSHRP